VNETPPVTVSRPPTFAVLPVAFLSGPLIGGLTVLLSLVLPWWAGDFLTNQVAAWGSVVILLGWWASLRLSPGQVALSGAAALLGAVLSYYAVGVLLTGGPAALLHPGWVLAAWHWLPVACLAGPLLTTAGTWIRHPSRPRRLAVLGLLGALCAGEGLQSVANWIHFRLTAPEAPPGFFTLESVLLGCWDNVLLGVVPILLLARHSLVSFDQNSSYHPISIRASLPRNVR
jgi:hypothetical protein